MSALFFLTNSQGNKKIILPNKQQEKFTIGRTPQNSLQIVDTTVSKNHALIYYFPNQKKYVLQDLGTVNGTHVNGKIIQKSKIYLEHNDSIQFGKCDQTYFFKNSNPEPEKKGKINFKDYHFELQEEIAPKPLIPVKKQNLREENFTEENSQNKIIEYSKTSNQKNNKQKFQRGAIKIPKFEEFLQLEGQDFQQQLPKKWEKNTESQLKKGAVKLPELNKNQLSDEDKMNRNILERKRQLQRAQKQALIKRTNQQQRMLQERLKLQIQKSQQQEQLLRQKYQVQKKAKEQQKNMLKEKMMLEQKIRLQQKELRLRSELLAQELRQKQQNLMNETMKNREIQMFQLKQKQKNIIKRLQQQKQKQIFQIKQKQVKKRQQKQQEISKDIQKRRRQLQLQAQALARQYENIYKQTIKKIKLNIQAEQYKVNQLQDQIQKADKDSKQLQNCLQIEKQQQNQLKDQFNDINGRNKAFLLYASHLQTKIDNLKVQTQKMSIKDPSKTSLQIKDSIIHSRKLLNMKFNQHKQLQNQIKQAFMKLNITSPQSEQYLATILQNYQEIQRLKQIYFQYLQEQKIIQNKWDLELEENNVLQEKLRNSKRQIQSNKKKLAENLNDNLKKLTQQRLHMLKMMYYAPQEKKNAAKFLVEQMVNIEQQNKAIILDSENVHHKVTNLIIEIEDKKRQNQHLSDLLFGVDSSSHYFDNMKEQINRCIQTIQNERDGYKIANLIKMSEQLRELQNKIYLETRRQKKIKEDIKNNGYIVPALNTQKNPLVFFGKLLMKKDIELHQVQQQQKIAQKKLLQMRNKVSALSDKKLKMNQLLQDYKQKQLRNVRDLLK